MAIQGTPKSATILFVDRIAIVSLLKAKDLVYEKQAKEVGNC